MVANIQNIIDHERGKARNPDRIKFLYVQKNAVIRAGVVRFVKSSADLETSRSKMIAEIS